VPPTYVTRNEIRVEKGKMKERKCKRIKIRKTSMVVG
jgi:hypothetical protein